VQGKGFRQVEAIVLGLVVTPSKFTAFAVTTSGLFRPHEHSADSCGLAVHTGAMNGKIAASILTRLWPALLAGLALTCPLRALSEVPQSDLATRALAHDVLKELIEINTTDSIGSTTLAANAMARRFRAAGFAAADVSLAGPNERKGNLVVRLRGKPGSSLKPLLIIGHTDVVEAKREDWTTDPFKLVEKDGYFYGRGTQDMKASDAIAVADLIRLKKEGFVPSRDIILALTADEEGGRFNGVKWLLEHHRELIDSEYVLNPDSGLVHIDKPATVEFEATEKVYADYLLMATNPGGHSSQPVPENAIYHIAHALTAVEQYAFPAEIDVVTHGFFEAMAKIETGQTAADMRAVLQTPPDPTAVARLSKDARYNATLRTTCVATLLAGGHAANALPQRASANVNCRVFPGHSLEDIRRQLANVIDDPAVSVRYTSPGGQTLDHAPEIKAMAVPPVRDDIMHALGDASRALWPGTAVMPYMEVGGSDSVYTMAAGMPSYGICGLAIDRDDDRMHGRDERLRITAYYGGLTFYYLLLKELTT
jgi:acetylornithine deacetylase/succinyl-diaminopimelate desuccinylase-like protein